ncbi:MAG: WD40/YVTN/BNR-like repeat-containing protein [Bacilli bacterium]
MTSWGLFKNRAAVGTALALIVTLSSGASAQSASSIHLNFRQLDMLNRTDGWALSARGVWRTTDGGKDWVSASPPGFSYNAVVQPNPYVPQGGFSALGMADAWVLQQAAAPNGDWWKATDRIWRTTDGGRTWRWSLLGKGGSGPTIQFLNRRDGFVMLVTGAAMGSEGAEVFGTTNGGRYWSNQKVELPPAWRSPSHAGGAFTYPPQFFGPQSGALAIGNRGLAIYTTHDGGKTWRMQSNAARSPNSTDFTYVQFVNEKTCFVISQGFVPPGAITMRLYETADDGVHWSERKAPPGLTQVDFVTPEIGWAVADGEGWSANVWKTKNGGVTWSEVQPRSASG